MSLLNKLAITLTVVIRIYSRDDTFNTIDFPTGGFGIINPLSEIQVALPFVRDYDSDGTHTNGVFHVYWSESVTPEVISEFKKKYDDKNVKTKVYASVGGRSSQYSFKISDGAGVDTWVSNAVKSLTEIISNYKLDGIDVYYEHIDANEEDFKSAIGKLITELKQSEVITVASIAPSPALNKQFYAPLFTEHSDSIDTVAYQVHNEVEPVQDPETLVQNFKTNATDIYGKDKVLYGYSAIYKDWNTVLPIVYFLGGLEVLGINSIPNILNPFAYDAIGTSIWFVFPDTPELTISNNNHSATISNCVLETTPRKLMAVA